MSAVAALHEMGEHYITEPLEDCNKVAMNVR